MFYADVTDSNYGTTMQFRWRNLFCSFIISILGFVYNNTSYKYPLFR